MLVTMMCCLWYYRYKGVKKIIVEKNMLMNKSRRGLEVTNNLEREDAVNILLSKLQEAEERVSVNKGKLGPYQEYEWDSPAGREQW